MANAPAQQLLRPGLLEGARVVLAGAAVGESELGPALSGRLAELGASVAGLGLELGEDVERAETQAMEGLAQARLRLGSLDAIVIDADGLLAAVAPESGLQPALAALWNAARAFASACIESGEPGRILMVAPGRGEHSGAAVAAVENLARTLSIEWARHAITTIAIAPSTYARELELAELCGYLLSPAGAYFSGCLLDLRGVG